MNKLVLIGNGFDLAHGLKTKYHDFIMWYLNGVFQELSNNYKYTDSLITASSRQNIGHLNFKSITEFQDYLKSYRDYINFKFKSQFFETLLKQINNSNWVNIESEYYSSLITLYKVLEKGSLNRHEHIDKGVKDLNECFETIKEKLTEYLKIVDKSEISIEPEIANHFINEFGEDSAGNIMFLNFNYTSTIEMYFEVLNHNNYVVKYIHGKLNDDNNPIIFGYGDEMDSYYQKIESLNSNEFLRNIKSFGYFKTNNYQKFSRFINSGSFMVYVIGHSCGISDRILLNSIVEHKNCRRVKIYYYEINDKENDYFEKTQELSRHFKPDFKGIMRNIITPFSDSEPLMKHSN